jgi:hypothetical protein
MDKELQQENAQLKADLQAVRELLKSLEWEILCNYENYKKCPVVMVDHLLVTIQDASLKLRLINWRGKNDYR